MPNLLTHSLLVKRFYIKVEAEDKGGERTFIQGNYDLLSLGSQGPDPLFYFGVVPFKFHLFTAKKRLGNKLHADDGKRFFKLLLDRSYGIDDIVAQRRFRSFIFGQFAHYILDRECHPYIIYFTGFDDNGKITGPYHYLHSHFEAMIDVTLAKKYRMNYFLEQPSEIIPFDNYFLDVIDKNLVPVLSQYFVNEKIPKHIYSQAISNMRFCYKFMNTHPDYKRKLIGKNSLGALALEKEVTEDVLNEKNEPWLDPVTGSKRYDSFMDLFMRAYDIIERCYRDLVKEGFSYDVFTRYINGLDYYGLPCKEKWVYKKG